MFYIFIHYHLPPGKVITGMIIKDNFCYFCTRTYFVGTGTYWNSQGEAIPVSIRKYVSVQNKKQIRLLTWSGVAVLYLHYINDNGFHPLKTWLTQSTLGKILSRRHFGIFSYFAQEIGFDISCKIVSQGDHLHEMSKSIFWKKKSKKKIFKNVSCWNFYPVC